MPIYEFECPVHGRFEKILPIAEGNNIQICNLLICSLVVEKVWSLPATVQIAKPTKFLRNPKTGEIKLLNREKESFNPPNGFIVEEAKGQFERLKLEKVLSKRQDEENQIVTERHRQIKSESTKNRQAENEANMSKYDYGTQQLLKSAMRRSRKKELPAKKSEFKFDVSHTNASNMKDDGR